ncbi:MAG: energy transducer TonB [Bacteroidota bacterium]
MERLILIVVIFSCFPSYGQDTIYYRTYDFETYSREDASIFELNTNASGEVRRYFLDGNLAMEAYSVDNSIQGEVIKYHKNAGIFEKSVYKNGKPFGKFKRWYPSGQLMGVFYGISEQEQIGLDYFEEIREFYFEDGRQSVVDGLGFAQTFYFDGSVAEQGDVSEGKKDGSWIGYNSEGGVIYRENYEKNKLIRGESYYNGAVYQYEEINISSEYPGGKERFNRIFDSLEHPQGKKRKRKTGTMFVFFVIEKDGSYSNIRFYYSLGPKFETVVKEALMNSKEWIPGKYRGIPLRQRMVQTVSFE